MIFHIICYLRVSPSKCFIYVISCFHSIVLPKFIFKIYMFVVHK